MILTGHTEARGSVQTQDPTLQQNISLPAAPPGPSASCSALPAVAGSLLLSKLRRGTQMPHPQWGRERGQLSTLLLSPPPNPCPAVVTHVSVPPSVTWVLRYREEQLFCESSSPCCKPEGRWASPGLARGVGCPGASLFGVGPIALLSRESPGKGGSLVPLPVLLCDGSKIQKVKL